MEPTECRNATYYSDQAKPRAPVWDVGFEVQGLGPILFRVWLKVEGSGLKV